MTQTVPSMATFNILLVEDAKDNVLLIKAFLRKSPYLVHVARNGREGVQMVQNGDYDYDLVLMDVEMPIMNGYSATQAIRAWEVEKCRQPLPIIALTAHSFAKDIQKTFDAGCNQHLTKPVPKAKLLEAIANYCIAS